MEKRTNSCTWKYKLRWTIFTKKDKNNHKKIHFMSSFLFGKIKKTENGGLLKIADHNTHDFNIDHHT